MNEPKSTRYQRLTRRTKVAEIAATAVLLTVLAFTPAARGLADLAGAPMRDLPGPIRTAGATAGFVGLIVLLRELFVLPVVLYVGLSVDRRFGRMEQTARTLLVAHLHATGIGFGSALIASALVLAATRLAGSLWWLVAGTLLALALAGALQVAGSLLPALGEAKPVTRRSLMSGLREIARRSGVPISDILEWPVDAGPATALVTGIGSTRRVLVASEVLRDWSDDEIAVVVAHELAHHVHRDLWRTLALDAAVLSLSLWIADFGLLRWPFAPSPTGPFDPAALPVIALMSGAVWLAATPIRLAQSRAHERRADWFALRLTGEAGSFGAAIRRLSARHLAEERPSRLVRWFFYRHPPVAERLALAEAFSSDKAS
jgi:STE24 endopeptidase